MVVPFRSIQTPPILRPPAGGGKGPMPLVRAPWSCLPTVLMKDDRKFVRVGTEA